MSPLSIYELTATLPLILSFAHAVPIAQESSPASSSDTSTTGFSFPLTNGFPNVTIPSTTLTAIEDQAHGTLPNSPLPTKISPISATVWQIIAFNEIFEVAFFTSLIHNITTNVTGFETPSEERNSLLANLHTIQAQEQLHALGANAVLTTSGHAAIQACRYVFPSNTLEDALSFASTFTDVVLGTLQEANTNFGLDGDSEFLGLIASIIGQEGEQNGFFRSRAKPPKIAPALPFLSAAAGAFAYSALNQMVVVPNSCPNSKEITVPIFGALNVKTPNVGPNITTLDFSYTYANSTTMPEAMAQNIEQTMSLVLINQQNVPVVEPLQDVRIEGSQVDFSVGFPYQEYELNGLTIAAVVHGSGPFANASDVAMSTVFGPALIEIN